MTLQDIIDQARRKLNNYELPYWWLEAELVLYANETINIICREGKILEDSATTSICDIATVAGTLDYSLSAYIIYVLSAKITASSTTVFLDKTTKHDMDIYYPAWRAATQAKPTKYLLDYTHGKITLYPPPDAVYTVNMSVIRYPAAAFTTTSMSGQTPEIPSQYHYLLVEGICYQAYLKTGTNTFDEKKSNTHYQLFRKGIGDIKITDNLFQGTGATIGPHRGFI